MYHQQIEENKMQDEKISHYAKLGYVMSGNRKMHLRSMQFDWNAADHKTLRLANLEQKRKREDKLTEEMALLLPKRQSNNT